MKKQQQKYKDSTKTVKTATGVEVKVKDPFRKHQTRILPTTHFFKIILLLLLLLMLFIIIIFMLYIRINNFYANG